MSNDTSKAKALSIIESLEKLTKRKVIVRISLNIILFNLIVLALFNASIGLFVELSLVIYLQNIFSIIYFVTMVNSEEYKSINKANVLEHINRQLAHYQESSQIILADTNQSTIKKLLANKVIEHLVKDFQSDLLKQKMPSFKWRSPFVLLITLSIIIFTSDFIRDLSHDFLADIQTIHNLNEDRIEDEENKTIKVTYVDIDILAPEYTGIKPEKRTELNFKIAENSRVKWEIGFNRKVVNAYIVFTSAANQSVDQTTQKVMMEYDNQKNRYTLSKQIISTQIYRVEVDLLAEENGSLDLSDKIDAVLIDGIYSISIIKDQPPKIKIITPKESLTEFTKSSTPSFELVVNVSDDYDISSAIIQASVAKGSGEAVKFRDKVFEFEQISQLKTKPVKQGNQSRPTRSNFRYSKRWQLSELDMEPGDEVYFYVVAKDNKKPEHQLTKSSSVIVRWLDDEETEIAAEGIRIGYIPEYFRSQRQIIIETTQLIEDRSDLDTATFKERSVDLGHSQSDLKTKYGQYLGDEFGEGPEEHFGLADGYHGGEVSDAGVSHSSYSEKDAHDEEHNEADHEEQNEYKNNPLQREHVEVSDESMGHETDLSGASELVSQFTHNHGTVEIAPLSKRDPKTWMKMAVNEMWQAELHLMLSEPAKALPFEKKAYKYLKQARKADRIYAKRLGFEPPPVTEERRLTGEMSEVKSSTIEVKGHVEDSSSEKLYRALFALINQWMMWNEEQKILFKLSNVQLELIKSLKNNLLQQATVRPVLIKYVAILEQVIIKQSLYLADCDECIKDLYARLWIFISDSKSLPLTRVRSTGISKDNEKQYLREFDRNLRSFIKKEKENKVD